MHDADPAGKRLPDSGPMPRASFDKLARYGTPLVVVDRLVTTGPLVAYLAWP
ncbi:hypothetical protein V5P93_002554 [Actinokineospora auranticolor]|uniref:hypothetical protein n=1 Tax=Actinokineospora auranticolor TaxID=155976 RepID=UPI0015E45272|nr:hypothetical protein [Actinokineospora auranticolor]